ncbi:MAG: beta-glucuronidase [Muribaculaceae bacterium]|nr:beta-glucuronidase [Muribaculaceae bacterium]
MKLKTLAIYVLAFFASFPGYAASNADTDGIPRPEYPRPQFERKDWKNLNGEWTYTFDFGKSGMDRRLYESKGFQDKITVPYCPESKLSGVGYVDFIPAMWYHREISIPEDWKGRNIVLNFGGVDYFSAVYIDGNLVGRHWGGSSSFSHDITKYVGDGKPHDLVVRVEDDNRRGVQPKGKQSSLYHSHGCDYTRTTGIWQTVWMEPVDSHSLASAYVVPDLDKKRFIVQPEFRNLDKGVKIEAIVRDGSKIVAKTVETATPHARIELPLKNVKTWSPESPFLYDIEFNVYDKNGKVVDNVKSYAGMRKVHMEGNRLYLNNEPYFLRLVLDQGFYPDGIWTAPDDADLKKDIEMSMAAGFNGARLHQKVFEERFHYWADKLGYLTWGETASWGADANKIEAARNFLPEWESIVVRDRNHPSIIAWTPFNETWERPGDSEQAMQHDRLLHDVYNLTHHLDYRPVNETSGNYHVITDLWTVHNYEQNPEKLAEYFVIKEDGRYPQLDPSREVAYGGQPFLIDEYGGIKWVDGAQFADNSWGYGDSPRTLEEFYDRLEKLTDVILAVPYMSGYCYTQLTDVEQEQNGIYNYNRTTKFDMDRIKKIFSKKPQGFK